MSETDKTALRKKLKSPNKSVLVELLINEAPGLVSDALLDYYELKVQAQKTQSGIDKLAGSLKERAQETGAPIQDDLDEALEGLRDGLGDWTGAARSQIELFDREADAVAVPPKKREEGKAPAPPS